MAMFDSFTDTSVGFDLPGSVDIPESKRRRMSFSDSSPGSRAAQMRLKTSVETDICLTAGLRDHQKSIISCTKEIKSVISNKEYIPQNIEIPPLFRGL
jgi:hypothetical protein